MRMRAETPGPSGFLVVDKPGGRTSHDLVDAARGWLGTRRVGHLGTLDPLATGVLPLAVREATKLVPFLMGGGKRYHAVIRLGVETETLDAQGPVRRRHAGPLPEAAAVLKALSSFEGEILQTPPMFSAVKRRGVPLHRLARQGLEVERAPRRVQVDRIMCLGCGLPDLELEIDCSSGTYIRALAADLGTLLGCGAHLAALRRLASGPFSLEHARQPQELSALAPPEVAALMIPPAAALGLPVLRLACAEARRVAHGGEIPAPAGLSVAGTKVAALDPEGSLLAVLELRANRALRPLRVVGFWPRVAPNTPLC
ncbi:MAG TPA: tRNA pseudouridine(55) synthase TruB [Myxococcota bacterium]|nr:tRNA pseudouridine(55) synthase TruB [Myxococcota bacterium]